MELPKINISAMLASVCLSLLFRFNVIDLNHNSGEPAYKNISSILLPLVLFINGAEKYQCIGSFLAILFSSVSRFHSLPVNQALFGAILSFTAHLGLYFLTKHCQDKQVGIASVNCESKIKSFLHVSLDLFLGIVVCDVIMALFDFYQVDIYNNELDITGVLVFALSTSGKFLALYLNSDCGLIDALMFDWVIKTFMFSFTYALGFKFDLTISNLLAIILWIMYTLGYVIVSKLKHCISFLEVKYATVINHLD
jgi:hypothetical protein